MFPGCPIKSGMTQGDAKFVGRVLTRQFKVRRTFAPGQDPAYYSFIARRATTGVAALLFVVQRPEMRQELADPF